MGRGEQGRGELPNNNPLSFPAFALKGVLGVITNWFKKLKH
jgi:hypothetical protein